MAAAGLAPKNSTYSTHRLRGWGEGSYALIVLFNCLYLLTYTRSSCATNGSSSSQPEPVLWSSRTSNTRTYVTSWLLTSADVPLPPPHRTRTRKNKLETRIASLSSDRVTVFVRVTDDVFCLLVFVFLLSRRVHPLGQ